MAATRQSSDEEKQEEPGRTIGYCHYSKFLASSNNFFIFRRFGSASARVALYLQDQITELEDELQKLDIQYSLSQEYPPNDSLRRDGQHRKTVVQQLHEKLAQYNEFLIQQSALRKLECPTTKDIKSLVNWHRYYGYAAIDTTGQEYLGFDFDNKGNYTLHDTTDLIRLVGKDKLPIRQLIDESLHLQDWELWRDKNKIHGGFGTAGAVYHSEERLQVAVSVVLVTLGTTMLLVPMWVLQAVDNLRSKLGVITAFVFAFLLVLSFAMSTKPFETLAATAAYAAVLMVFLQVDTSGL